MIKKPSSDNSANFGQDQTKQWTNNDRWWDMCLPARPETKQNINRALEFEYY